MQRECTTTTKTIVSIYTYSSLMAVRTAKGGSPGRWRTACANKQSQKFLAVIDLSAENCVVKQQTKLRNNKNNE